MAIMVSNVSNLDQTVKVEFEFQAIDSFKYNDVKVILAETSFCLFKWYILMIN